MDFTTDTMFIVKHSPGMGNCVLLLVQVASSGNIREFERLYKKAPSRLNLRDPRGQNAFHHAAAKSRDAIMDFILNHGGGNGGRQGTLI